MDLTRPPSPWPRRLRVTMLLCLVVAGLAVAGYEKGRPAEANQMWGRVYGRLAGFLDPVSDRTRSATHFARRIRLLWRAEAENERLRREVTSLATSSQLLGEQLGKLQRLSGLGSWVAPPDLQLVPVDVTGMDTHEQNAVLIINRGREDGIAPRDPMVSLGGLVGLVREVSAHSARVQTLADPASAVGVMVRENRSHGVVFGRGRGAPLEFAPETEVQPIEQGNVLVTSGFEKSVFPKGLLIGVIRKPKVSVHGMNLGQVEPAVALDQVEEGLVIVPRGRRALADEATTFTLGRFTIQMPHPPASLTGMTSGPLSLAEPGESALLPDRESSGSLISIRTTSATTTSARPTTTTVSRAPAGSLTPTPSNAPRSAGAPRPTPTPRPSPTPTATPEGEVDR